MRKRASLWVVMGMMGLSLVGCGQIIQPVATEPDIVSERIAAASEKAARALDDVSSIEQTRTPVPAPNSFAGAPPSMTQIISVKWTGPLDKIVRSLATRAGMTYRAYGSEPPVPIVVAVDAYQKPLIEVMRDVGLQAGKRANINVNGTSGVVEIRYAPVER